MGWLGGITDSVLWNLSALWEMVEDRGAWRAVVLELQTTEPLNDKLLRSTWRILASYRT